MAEETYRCSGCRKIRKAPENQDITRCRICGTVSEKIDGVWLQSSGYARKSNSKPNTFSSNWVGFLLALIFGLSGCFLAEPITQTSWGSALLKYSGLYLGITSIFFIGVFSLLLMFILKKNQSFLIFSCLSIFCVSGILKLSFVDKSISLLEPEIQVENQVKEESLVQYSESELLELADLFFETMTDSEKLQALEKSSELTVVKTLDEEEKNYDYVITPADTNNLLPDAFRMSINNQIATELQNEYYVETSGGLGMRIKSQSDAELIKNNIVQKFSSDFDLFEPQREINDGTWFSIQSGNYYWVRFLTLEPDFMILEITRYLTDAEARQHKKVMESTKDYKGLADTEPKPLSPQEALACKEQSAVLSQERIALSELEKRLAYLDYGDTKSEEHISKTREFENRTKQYQADFEKYKTGCELSVSLSLETYSTVCSIDDFKNQGNASGSINRFCNSFPALAKKLN